MTAIYTDHGFRFIGMKETVVQEAVFDYGKGTRQWQHASSDKIVRRSVCSGLIIGSVLDVD